MATLFDRLSLRNKLILLLIVPLGAALFFAGLNLVNQFHQYRSLAGIGAITRIAQDIDDLVIKLRRERGLLAATLLTDDTRFSTPVQRSREEVDALRAQVQALYDSQAHSADISDIQERIEDWLVSLRALDTVRGLLHSKSVNQSRTAEAIARYNDWVATGSGLLASIYQRYRDPQISPLQRALSLLLQAEESGGHERRLILNILLEKSFSQDEAAVLQRTTGALDSALEDFTEVDGLDQKYVRSLREGFAALDRTAKQATEESLAYHLTKIELLNELKIYTGFGGLIHDFKNFVLRGKPEDMISFRDKHAIVTGIIDRIRNLPGRPREDSQLLDVIAQTFAEYGGHFEIVATLHETGTSIEIIDQTVVVDDEAARNALRDLGQFRSDVDPFDWWLVSSARLDAVSATADRMKRHVYDHIVDVGDSAFRNFVLNGVLLLFVAGFACLLAASVYRRTMGGIGQTVAVMKQIAATGDLDTPLPPPGSDEIGQLAEAIGRIVEGIRTIVRQAEVVGLGDFSKDIHVRGDSDHLSIAFNRMIENTREVLEKAEAIAEGNYDVDIQIRGENDQLGQALTRMAAGLREYSDRNRQEQWVKNGQVEVSRMVSGDVEEQALAEQAVTFLAQYSGAEAAVFYGLRDDRLVLLSSFAYTRRKELSSEFAVGEGVAGQSVRERKPIMVSEVPEGYFEISSGLGRAPAGAVLVVPVIVGDECFGAMEFGFFGRPDAVVEEFLESIGENVAVALQRARARSQLQDLLDRTQEQADRLAASEEELQAQSEELRASNEEMEEKNKLLEASEEALKSQAEELRATNEELSLRSDELEERNRQIELARVEIERKAREVEQASRYKSEFLANMSHELRTPLNSMLILSKMLADNEDGNLSDDEVESAKVVHESGSNLLTLINDILDLSKIEAGKVELHLEPLNFHRLAQALERRYRPLAESRNITFDVEIGDGVPEQIVSDPMRVEQVVTNLVSNALKFTHDGGVTVHVRMEQDEASGRVGIDVRDTGIGIPPDKVDKVFRAFEQADGSTTRKYGGTGLGLAISNQLAHLLGGEIGVASEEGKGSTFTLYVPLEPPEVRVVEIDPETAELSDVVAPAAGAPAPETDQVQEFVGELPPPPVDDDRDAINDGDRCIVIIEDDANFAKALVATVRAKGFRVVVANDGETGVRLVREFQPVGVLLDISLPGADGWSVMGHLKGNSETSHIPVHFISGEDETARAASAGAAGFATKPVSSEDIDGALARILAAGTSGARRVLIVEDDAADREMVVNALTGADVEIEQAADAEDALALLEEGKPFTCVVLDLTLPDKSGQEFLREAKSRGIHMPPVIVHTGVDLSEEETEELGQFVSAFVMKTAASRNRLIDEVTLFLHSVKAGSATDSVPIPPSESDTALRDKTVLVVDDDMRNVFAMAKVLRAQGMHVLKAPDGERALAQLKENGEKVDIILMDIMMPVMDGYDATRAIRGIPEFADLPVIALTAKAMKGDREKCIEAGANDYLAKPVDVPKLLSMMRTWLA